MKDKFGQAVLDTALDGGHPHAVIDAARWPDIARFLRDDPRLGFSFLRSVSAVDLSEKNKLACIYDLLHIPLGPDRDQLITTTREFAVRIVTERDDPHIPSVADVWPTADWHEREAYDMMGIAFDNHPDLRRILCPDDWEGHPLRKDYEFPLEYHGIPATTEYELTNPRH